MKTKKTTRKSVKRFKAFLVIFILCTISYGFYSPLTVTQYKYYSPKIPTAFDGFKIIQISDFHCKAFGKEEQTLINKISKLSPDIILLTGDMVDEIHPTDNFKYLIAGISKIAPIYAILGNHDNIKASSYNDMLSIFKENNVVLLDNEQITLSKPNSSISLSGAGFLDWAGNCIKSPESGFNILMFHDSNAFPTTSKLGYDIIFSGHTHGGIIRFPFIGGILDNSRKLFPKYDGGLFYNQDTNCTMYSSRGLGDSMIHRFFNPPEIVEVTLYCK